MICGARESSDNASPDHFCHHLECFPSIGALSTGCGNAMSNESEREHNSRKLFPLTMFCIYQGMYVLHVLIGVW